MMSGSLTQQFNHIIDALSRMRRTILLGRLRPGCDVKVISGTFASRGLSAPPGILELFSLHDGTDVSGSVTLDDIHLFPGFYLMSLADAVSNYDAFRADARWKPAWVPIFANGGGDFYAAVCDDANHDFGRIVHFRIEDLDHPIEFASIEAMFRTLAAAFDQAVFYVDADGYLEMDDHQFVSIAGSLNADIPYWSV